jgi:hypothetical protein
MAYAGQKASIPLGEFGLITDLPPGDIPRGGLIRAQDISFETGLVTKAPGDSRYNNSALPAGVVAAFDWWPDPVTQRLIAACSDGFIYKDIGDRGFNLNVPVSADLGTLNPRSVFVEGGNELAGRNKKLFFISPSAQVQVMSGDGTMFNPISSPAVDWVTPNFPSIGLIHRNRLWAFMGQRAYASDTGNHENFVSNFLTQNIFPGEGGSIIGAKVFKGRLFAFKEGGFVYYLEDSDQDSDNWNWLKLASNFGLASPHGILEIINDMVAVNESGSPISYNATDALGDIESADVLRMLQIEDYFRKNTHTGGIEFLHSIYYEAKKQAFFTWRSTYRTTNDTLFVLDFNRQNPRAAFWKRQADCLALRRNQQKILQPIYGSSDGFIYLMDRENRLIGASAYTGEFKTGHMDFKFMGEDMASKNKLYDFLEVEFVPQGAWNISVDVFIDGKFSETINYSMDVRDDGLDSFTLGSGGSSGITTPSGGDGDPLGREEAQTLRKPLHGSGRRISFLVRGSGANQNFAIASLNVGFRISAEQATRV